jgi:nitrogen fixation protein FixH
MNQTATGKKTSAWRSPWVIGWIGLILLVLTANLIMVYLAIKSNPGLVVEDYYERGQDYERTMVSRLARDPGWLMNLDVPETITAGTIHRMHFVLVDKAGQPVDPDGVTLFAYRPSDAARDFSVDMAAEAEGRFKAEISFPLIGTWDLLVSVRSGEDEYNLGERISVAKPSPEGPER